MACTLLACAAEEPAGGAGMSALDEEVSFAATVQPLLNEACNCHQSEPFLMAPFSLKPIDAYENLVDKPSGQLPAMMFVKPSVLNESYLWHKVSGTQLDVGGSGMIMPYTIPLNDEERMIIARWIAAGAKP
jgi:hypothetical protein